MKNAYKKVRVHYPVKRPDEKRAPRKPGKEVMSARAFAASIVNEISGFSPLEKKVISLIEAKNKNKAQKILRKRLGSHKRAVVKLNKLEKMLIEK